MKRSLFLTAALLCFSGCDSPESRYKAALETFRIEEQRCQELRVKSDRDPAYHSEWSEQTRRLNRARQALKKAESNL